MVILQCKEDYGTREDLLFWKLRNLGSQVGDTVALSAYARTWELGNEFLKLSYLSTAVLRSSAKEEDIPYRWVWNPFGVNYVN